LKHKLIIFFFLSSLLFSKTISLSNLKALCFRKNSDSCNLVATWYISQQEKDKDSLKNAKVFYELSCRFGNAEGCYYVGNFYNIGQGGPKIKNAAKQYFKVSCLGGYSNACFELGTMLVGGIDALKYADEGIYYFKKSCYLGNDLGCSNYKALKNSLKDF